MKKFPLDGDNEGKEVSLFVVPVSVKGAQQIKEYLIFKYCSSRT